LLVLATIIIFASPTLSLATLSAVCPPGTFIVPGYGIGRIMLGMPLDAVLRSMGPPQISFPPLSVPARFRNVRYADIGGAGSTDAIISIMVAGNHVSSVALRAPYPDVPCRTEAGLRIGSPAADITRFYGPPNGTYVSSGVNMTTMAYDSDSVPGLVLHVLDGKVSWIAVVRRGSCGGTLNPTCLQLTEISGPSQLARMSMIIRKRGNLDRLGYDLSR
jgi:hypothetical protein